MRFALPSVLLGGLLAACSGRDAGTIAPATDDVTATPEPEPVDPAGPHALGTVTLSSGRHAGDAAERASLVVSFVPDARAVRTCNVPVVAGCELVVACPAAGPSAGASFDAGTVTVSGATAMNARPPYPEATAAGPAFGPGAALRVSAEGAAGAGFEAFEASSTTTAPVTAEPALAALAPDVLWGTGDVPVAWVPGSDTLTVTASGAGGAVRCAADDAQGRFTIPRAALKAARGQGTLLELGLEREHRDVSMGLATKGDLGPRTGWLVVTTRATEAASFTCSGDECTGTPNKTSCQDCRTSLCKTEFDACTADATCPMLRTCLDDCADGACRNQCFVKWPQASAKQKNAALYVCQCTTRCSTECKADCS